MIGFCIELVFRFTVSMSNLWSGKDGIMQYLLLTAQSLTQHGTLP